MKQRVCTCTGIGNNYNFMSGVSAPSGSFAASPPASYFSSPMATSLGGASHYQMSGDVNHWPDVMSQRLPPAMMSK